jgi:hypothetical protein
VLVFAMVVCSAGDLIKLRKQQPQVILAVVLLLLPFVGVGVVVVLMVMILLTSVALCLCHLLSCCALLVTRTVLWLSR